VKESYKKDDKIKEKVREIKRINFGYGKFKFGLLNKQRDLMDEQEYNDLSTNVADRLYHN